MRTSLACVFGLALLVGISHGAPEASAAGLAKRIQDANPASAEGARQVISLLHAELLKPASQVSSAAKGLCGRYLPTAIGGMKRGHVATCALRADAYEALAVCKWLSGDRKSASTMLTKKLSLLDCPAEGVDGVRRGTRLASGWLQPEFMEPIVFKQRASVENHPDASARAKRAVELNVQALAEARRQRSVVRSALGKRPPSGLLVLASQGGSSSAKAGLRRDDVIVLAGATPVRGMNQLRELSVKAPSTPITVYRRGAPVQLVLRGGLTGLEALEVPALK